MNPRTALKILERLQELERRVPQVRLGVITDTSPLSVAVGGSDTPYTNVKIVDGPPPAIDDIVAVLRFGADLLILGKPTDGIEPWRYVGDPGEPGFENSWVNYGSADARFKKVGGVVHVQGVVKDGTVNHTIFTLPDGYRPDVSLDFVQGNDGGYSQIRVEADGEVIQSVWTSNVSQWINFSFSL